MNRRIALAAVAGAAALAAAVAVALPPKARFAPPPRWTAHRTVVAGAFHVHTNRSDGTGSPDEVAAAAARAGLRFVVFMDHGDGTRTPDPPVYRSGVLTLDGVEVSTGDGHYAVLGLPRAPYPLAGEARDVVEDVSRLGGWGVAAHVDSPKRDLAWTDDTVISDGFEWLNLDSEWRRASPPQIAAAVLAYPLRGREALASVIGRPGATLAWWDARTMERPLVGVAATDAHAAILGEPSYESCFRTMTTQLELDAPLSGHAAEDARAVTAALQAGHHHSAIDALASPPAFEFTARQRESTAREGDALPPGPVTLHVRSAPLAGARVVLFRNGAPLAETDGAELEVASSGDPAVFRSEVWLRDAPNVPMRPWIVSNPIYVGPPRSIAPSPSSGASGPSSDLMTAAWDVEHDVSSTAALTRSGGLALRYSLGSGRPAAQFAALVHPLDAPLSVDSAVTFAARASRPLRVSVQLRLRGSNNPPRWYRSIYLDETPRTVTIPVSDLHAVGGDKLRALPLDAVGALMFVLDTNNTAPGTSGEVAFSDVGLKEMQPRRHEGTE